jgi:HK97 family phage major capsid protein
MAFGDIISRADAGPILMPEEVSTEIFQSVEENSVVGQLARRLPNMASSVRRLPVLSTLPNVYFVGEKGRTPQTFGARKQTTEQIWANKYLKVEEMACIVVVPENVLDDEEFDVWEEVKPKISEAIGAKMDSAIIFGESDVDVPVDWPDGIFVGMPVSHIVTLGDVGTLYEDIFDVGGVLSKFEEDGYLASGHLGALTMRARLRGMKDDNGNLIYVQDLRSNIPYSLDGLPLVFPRNGSFDPATALLLSGDWQQLVWAVRRDVDFKIFTEGVITDDSTPPQITHNLLQEDSIALRVTFRMAWQLPNPVNRINTNSATRYPFSVLVPATPSV